MFAPDYKGEKALLYNGTEYSVYRTYVDRNELIDLYTEQRRAQEKLTLFGRGGCF